jgi:hypothetical protein
MPSASIRSPRVFIACLVLLSGVHLAALLALALGNDAEMVVHATLGATFLLIAFGLRDFRLPALVTLLARIATGGLATVFLLQCVSDVAPTLQLTHVAYDILGQRLEKCLGYAFLLWCFALLLFDRRGGTKRLGAFAMAVVLGVEFYCICMALVGIPVTGLLKLCYVLLFVWLLLEARKPRTSRSLR